jgi:uncharacterized protein YeaO (DUF488 family)
MNLDFILYTSYFSRFDKLVKRGEDNISAHQGISIARSKPHDTECAKYYQPLAPFSSLLKKWKHNELSWGQYTEEYNAQLEELDAHDVLEDLLALMRDNKSIPILLCWENSDGLCHRHLVANWMERELGIKVDELYA